MRYYIVVMRYIIGFIDIKVGASVFRSALQWCGFGMNSEIHTVIDRNRRPVPYSSVPIPHCNEWQRMSTVCIPCIPCIFRVYTGYRPYWRCRDNSEKLLTGSIISPQCITERTRVYSVGKPRETEGNPFEFSSNRLNTESTIFYSEHERSDDSDKCDRGFRCHISK